MKQIYNLATCKIELEGTEYIPFSLFSVLNGKDTNDYVSRVEPSDQGGKKIASKLLEVCKIEQEADKK